VLKPLLLLDRDGTLITEQDYLKDPRKVRFLAGSLAGLKQLSRAGFQMVVISNQSGIGRGLMTRRDVERVNQRFLKLLKSQGIQLEGIYYCPHHPQVRCSCRKPKLGLVKKAARDLKRPWRHSISVGDKKSDVALGQRTGGQGALVLTGIGRLERHRERKIHPDFVAKNFKAAARWILHTTQKESRS
jgi:D-glycero-D-manno-heptose 1,7-bisphosphate phosphatase